MASLWEAAGRPPLAGFLPLSSSPAWAHARSCLEAALTDRGVRKRIRSSAALWILVRGSAVPPGATWARLCQGFTLQDLVQRIRDSSHCDDLRISTWNVRWLVSPNTDKAAAKRSILVQLLLDGHVVLLQETHWTDQSAAQWGGHFPTASVISSSSRPGPRGGPQGGVAILVPRQFRVTGHREVVPGCCVEATLRRGDAAEDSPTTTVRSLYLPPDSRQEILGQLAADPALGAADRTSLYIAGDVNIQVDDPRNPEEERDARALEDYLAACGATRVPGVGPTRNGASRTSLDIVAAPSTSAWTWRPSSRWLPGLSDHACITAVQSVSPPVAGRRCTPAAMARLPQDAMRDLRGRFLTLERTFGIQPHHDHVLPFPAGAPQPPRDGGLPGDHPAQDVAGHTDGDPPDEDDLHSAESHGAPSPDPGRNARDDHIPHIPALARRGRAFLDAMIRSWWETWRRRRSPDCDIGAELVSIAHGHPGHCLSSALLRWLAAIEQTDRELSPERAARLLTVWRHTEAARRAQTTPARLRGPTARRTQGPEAVRIGRSVYRQRHTIRGVRDGQGGWHEHPTEVEAILWTSRADIWGSHPDAPAGGGALLRRYFQNRRGSFPAVP